MLPLVSVIIPVFNVKPYLREALNSVVNQTYEKLEIIIVDDGSTDGSSIICDEFLKLDSRITVIHQANLGLSEARNAGLDAMHGEIVTFLDSDDAFLPSFIQIMVQCMIAEKADIVVCGFYICHTKNQMDNTWKKRLYKLKNESYSSTTALQRLVNRKINSSVWNKIYRSTLFSSLRFRSGHNYEDLTFLPLLFEKANCIKTISCPLVYYRKHPSSITATPSEKNTQDFIAARKIMYRFINTHIPDVFSIEQKERFIDECLMTYISKYLDILFSKDKKKVKVILSNEIKKGNTYVKKCRLMTRFLYYSFNFNPFACYVFHRCFRAIEITMRFIKSFVSYHQ